MDLGDLRGFVAAVDAGCIAAAAGTLQISATQLLARIGHLERYLGVPLLASKGDAGSPTDAGRRVYRDAIGMLAMADAMRARIKLPPDAMTGRITLAAPVSLAKVLTAPLMVQARESLPGVQLVVISEDAEIAMAAVIQGDADFGVLIEPPASTPLQWRPLAREPYLLVGADPQRLAWRVLIPSPADAAPDGIGQLPCVRVADVAGLPMFAQSPRMWHRRITDAIFAAQGLVPNIVHEIDSIHTVLQIYRQGIAYGITAASMAATELLPPGGIRARLVEPDCFRTLGLAWCPDRQVTALDRAVVGLVRNQVTQAIDSGIWHAQRLDNTDDIFA